MKTLKATRAFVLCTAMIAPGCYGPDAGDSSESTGTVTQPLASSADSGFAFVSALVGTTTPDPQRSFNGTGGPITVQSPQLGVYFVQFAGITSNTGNVQVVSYGSDNTRCKATGWSQGTVGVLCHRASDGALTPGLFLVSYNNDLRTQGGTAGFMLSTVTNGAHTPSSTWSYNSTGQTNIVSYLGKGLYFAQFTSLTAPNLNAQVTAVGRDSAYCKTTGWSAWQGHTLVGVACFDNAGNPADSLFSVQLIGAFTREGGNRAYSWSDQLIARTYTPNTSFQFESMTGMSNAITGGWQSAGQYVVHVPDMPPFLTPSTAMVTAVGSDNVYCNPMSFDTGGVPDLANVSVSCHKPGGILANSTFSTTFVTQEPPACTVSGCPEREHLVQGPEWIREDNPRLTGYAFPANWTWNATDTGEQYGGPTASMITTQPAALIADMKKDAFVPSLPAGSTAEIYRPHLVNRLPPWVLFPAGGCTSPTSCNSSGTFPFFAPGLDLPRNRTPVRVSLVNIGSITAPDQEVNARWLGVDSSVPIVPVHVHVIQASNGTVPLRYTYPFSLTDRVEAAWQIRQLFDQANARDASTIALVTSTGATVQSIKARDPLLPRTNTSGLPVYGDDIYGQCGVQLRVESVSFIKQNKGLENDLVPPNQTGFTVLCNSAAGTALVTAMIAAYNNQTTIPHGVHVFVGGWIGRQTSDGSNGITCIQQRYSYVDAGGSGSNILRAQTLFHEIGHVLMQDAGHPGDLDNLMNQSSSGTLLTPAQCQEMLPVARQY